MRMESGETERYLAGENKAFLALLGAYEKERKAYNAPRTFCFVEIFYESNGSTSRALKLAVLFGNSLGAYEVRSMQPTFFVFEKYLQELNCAFAKAGNGVPWNADPQILLGHDAKRFLDQGALTMQQAFTQFGRVSQLPFPTRDAPSFSRVSLVARSASGPSHLQEIVRQQFANVSGVLEMHADEAEERGEECGDAGVFVAGFGQWGCLLGMALAASVGCPFLPMHESVPQPCFSDDTGETYDTLKGPRTVQFDKEGVGDLQKIWPNAFLVTDHFSSGTRALAALRSLQKTKGLRVSCVLSLTQDETLRSERNARFCLFNEPPPGNGSNCAFVTCCE